MSKIREHTDQTHPLCCQTVIRIQKKGDEYVEDKSMTFSEMARRESYQARH